MPRYAIKPARVLSLIPVEADDAIDATNHARRALIDLAKHGELYITRLPDAPYDHQRDARSEARYEETDDDRETERLRGLRWALFAAESDSEAVEPW